MMIHRKRYQKRLFHFMAIYRLKHNMAFELKPKGYNNTTFEDCLLHFSK